MAHKAPVRRVPFLIRQIKWSPVKAVINQICLAGLLGISGYHLSNHPFPGREMKSCAGTPARRHPLGDTRWVTRSARTP